GEIKFENTISRLTGIANPRQIERVPAGTIFDFKLVYNVENKDELIEDMQTLAGGLKLLQADYLGGHGSRGYGRVSFEDLNVKQIINEDNQIDINEIESIFKGSK
ncbi:MAG: type III-A CRISPR-associated RAMP protein Csm3, partial [Firmicutes bacterium]|nr:type III-A CRISPR-associated RAMP protein Csm3 [Candidatus Alectryobacillus merdavium]